MGVLEGVTLAIGLLSIALKVADFVVDKFFPESDAVKVLDVVGTLVGAADDVTDILNNDEVKPTGEENSANEDAASAT